MARIIRVFPSRTRATPVDERAYVGLPEMWTAADEIHISVTFSWDLPAAERLAREWEWIAPVKIGGPATGMRGEAFLPGQYLKPGYVITSRGCPNTCWFCTVWRREGPVRELAIRDGWNLLDDNLLACSEAHIREVFAMLKRQTHPVELTGGLEAKRLRWWHIDLLADLRPAQVWFAYDTADDWEPLLHAAKLLKRAGLLYTRTGHVSHRMRCYVLIGDPGDTLSLAEKRLRETYTAGFLPMAMLYRPLRDSTGKRLPEWQRFQKLWARPASVNRLCRGPKLERSTA